MPGFVIYYRHGKTIEQKAALPFCVLQRVFYGPLDGRKEGDAMYVTYQDLVQIGILIVALANLIYQIYKGKRK